MQNRRSYVFIALLAGTFMLACLWTSGEFETPTPQIPLTATGTAVSIELSDAEITSGIQAALDIIMEAYAKNDVALLEGALDLENKSFSRFVKTRFNTQQESFYGDGIDLSYEVISITRRDFGLVLAHIAYNGDAAVDWAFRRLEDGRWVLTEPTVQQTGEMVVRETEFFEFRTYPWADDVNAKVEGLMQNARGRVETMLGKVPQESIEVEIIPTYGLYPFDSPNALAYYSHEGAFDGEGDRMVIYAPNSFLFGWYEESNGWEQDLENVLTHEYTHMTHARSFDYLGRLSDWIVEGLAEYVDGVDRNGVLRNAIDSDSLIPLVDTREGITYKQDLAHLSLLEKDVSLAYAQAESLVAFIVEEHGGFDGFWSFAQAYTDTSGDLDKALRNSLGLSQTQFEAQWLTWVKESGYLSR